MTNLKLLAAAALALQAQAASPPFVRLSLAGQSLRGSTSSIRYDAKSRYFLIATGLCNGSRDLILTPSPAASGIAVDDRKYLQQKNVRRTSLSLSVGDVRISDSVQAVQRKLGAKPQQIGERRSLNGREWMYAASIKTPGVSKAQHYSARYLFRGGKLWAIRLSLSESDECG